MKWPDNKDFAFTIIEKKLWFINKPVEGEWFLYKFEVSPNKWIDYMFSARPILVSLNGYRSIISEANCGKFINSDNVELVA